MSIKLNWNFQTKTRIESMNLELELTINSFVNKSKSLSHTLVSVFKSGHQDDPLAPMRETRSEVHNYRSVHAAITIASN